MSWTLVGDGHLALGATVGAKGIRRWYSLTENVHPGQVLAHLIGYVCKISGVRSGIEFGMGQGGRGEDIYARAAVIPSPVLG